MKEQCSESLSFSFMSNDDSNSSKTSDVENEILKSIQNNNLSGIVITDDKYNLENICLTQNAINSNLPKTSLKNFWNELKNILVSKKLEFIKDYTTSHNIIDKDVIKDVVGITKSLFVHPNDLIDITMELTILGYCSDAKNIDDSISEIVIN